MADEIFREFLYDCWERSLPDEEDSDISYVVNRDFTCHDWYFDPREEEIVEPIGEFQTNEFRRILNQQLRQHVQLLTQVYLMTYSTLPETAELKFQQLKDIGAINNGRSCPVNYAPSLELIRKYRINPDGMPGIRLSWRGLPLPESIVKEIDSRRDIFIYRSLHPTVAFSKWAKRFRKRKIFFTPSEDHLLAYALHEFKDEQNIYDLIAKLLMVAKTKTQISNHIKNIKRSKEINDNNPLDVYLKTTPVQAPQVDHSDIDVDFVLPSIKPALRSIKKSSPVKPEPPPSSAPSVTPTVSTSQADLMDDNAMDLIGNYALEVMEGASPEFTDDHAQESMDDNASDMNDDNVEDLEALMTASTTIGRKPAGPLTKEQLSKRELRAIKQRKSMIYLMSQQFDSLFDLSESGGFLKSMQELIINYYLKQCELRLNSYDYMKLLNLFKDIRDDQSQSHNQINGFKSILQFLNNIQAPPELRDALCLFMTADQAEQLNCSLNHLYWMKHMQFMRNVIMYSGGEAGPMSKLYRCVLALCKQRAGPQDMIGMNTGFVLDSSEKQKILAAVSRIVDGHPFLMREFNSLFLEQRSHHSLFEDCEDFEELTNMDTQSLLASPTSMSFEDFSLPPTKEETKGASRIKYRVDTRDWTFEEDKSLLEFCQSKVTGGGSSASNSVDTAIFQEYVARQKASRDVNEVAKRFHKLVELYVHSME